MTLATRMAVMNDGVIEQVGPPLELFNRPDTIFVARFVGAPAINLWPGTWPGDGGIPRVTTTAFTFDASGAMAAPAAAVSNVVVGVRPHDIDLTPPGEGDVNGSIELIESLGAWLTIHVRVKGFAELVRVATGDAVASAGDRVGLRVRRDRVHLFDAATGRSLAGRE